MVPIITSDGRPTTLGVKKKGAERTRQDLGPRDCATDVGGLPAGRLKGPREGVLAKGVSRPAGRLTVRRLGGVVAPLAHLPAALPTPRRTRAARGRLRRGGANGAPVHEKGRRSSAPVLKADASQRANANAVHGAPPRTGGATTYLRMTHSPDTHRGDDITKVGTGRPATVRDQRPVF